MKSVLLFVVGAAVVVVAMVLPLYEPLVEALAAVTFVAAVAVGFLLRPRRDVFYIRTTVHATDLERNVVVEHDQLAIKVEPVRLWLLFLPTFLAVAFLTLTAAEGTLWKFSLLDRLLAFGFGPVVIGSGRLLILLIGGALWVWLTERRVFRDADACSARAVTVKDGRVGYQFMDRNGGYGGGEGVYFGLVKLPVLARLVFYDVQKTEVNKIGMGLLFHRPMILGRGVTDLDHETVAARRLSAATASEI